MATKEPEKRTCPICGREYKGYGNNPYPIAADGQVCDECNRVVVIPTRFLIHRVRQGGGVA